MRVTTEELHQTSRAFQQHLKRRASLRVTPATVSDAFLRLRVSLFSRLSGLPPCSSFEALEPWAVQSLSFWRQLRTRPFSH